MASNRLRDLFGVRINIFVMNRKKIKSSQECDGHRRPSTVSDLDGDPTSDLIDRRRR